MKKIISFVLTLLMFYSLTSGANINIASASGDYDFLSQNVIRLHILADGDDDISREIKLSVRDAVLEEFSDEMSGFSSKEDARMGITSLLGDIKIYVDEFLRENSVPYSCRTELGQTVFPDRTYDEIFFPAGEYTALRILLGSGKGENWWCVMYPPLCFAQMYDDEDIPDDEVHVKWKLAEWWEDFWAKEKGIVH